MFLKTVCVKIASCIITKAIISVEKQLSVNNHNHPGIYRLGDFSHYMWLKRLSYSLHFMGCKSGPQKNFSKKMHRELKYIK